MVSPIDQIDLALLKVAFPSNKAAELSLWCEPLQAACKRWGINTVREVASFLANIAVESRDLTDFSENLNYSADALVKLFGPRRISAADAQRYGRTKDHPANPSAIANCVYGGEWGRNKLGNLLPTDGWTFRGAGPLQITGRRNHQAFATAMGMNVNDMPKYLLTREGGAMGAGWFWKSHDMDERAETPGWVDDRKGINGGTNGLSVVEERANALVKELLKRGC